MPQVDLITGESRHRHWTVEEKLSILAAAFAPGAVVREIARRANVSTGQSGFAPGRDGRGSSAAGGANSKRLAAPSGHSDTAGGRA
jgi:hypothetical protein